MESVMGGGDENFSDIGFNLESDPSDGLMFLRRFGMIPFSSKQGKKSPVYQRQSFRTLLWSAFHKSRSKILR
jgi:hypothetical protein